MSNWTFQILLKYYSRHKNGYEDETSFFSQEIFFYNCSKFMVSFIVRRSSPIQNDLETIHQIFFDCWVRVSTSISYYFLAFPWCQPSRGGFWHFEGKVYWDSIDLSCNLQVVRASDCHAKYLHPPAVQQIRISSDPKLFTYQDQNPERIWNDLTIWIPILNDLRYPDPDPGLSGRIRSLGIKMQ